MVLNLRFTKLLLGVALLITALAPRPAWAWAYYGHQAVATLAEERLSPAARQKVRRLLALEHASSLAEIATWADEHKSPATARWHFVNLPDADCVYVPARDCPEGQCVVAALERQLIQLRKGDTDEEKLRALKYVTHLVADAFQPLHAGRRSDKGGNTYQLRLQRRGTNLHEVWDGGMVPEKEWRSRTFLASLRKEMASAGPATAPASWVAGSCEVVNRPGFYPKERKLDETYTERWRPVMTARLASAAVALARVLNDTLK